MAHKQKETRLQPGLVTGYRETAYHVKDGDDYNPSAKITTAATGSYYNTHVLSFSDCLALVSVFRTLTNFESCFRL